MSSGALKLHRPASSCVVIPARLASTRLPGKLLLRETGKSVIQHTYESAMEAKLPTGVWVATDHEEIYGEVVRFGGRALMTDPAAASGTDRVAEAALALAETDIVVNVQGDEPELSGSSIDRAIELLLAEPETPMSTLATPIRNREQLLDPACVKVVFDDHRRALYFSRAPIPFAREWSDELLDADPPLFYQHIGLYAYRREFLLRLSSMPRSPLEAVENLEQLRVLSAGHPILVGVVGAPGRGIDTPEDYRQFVLRYCRQ